MYLSGLCFITHLINNFSYETLIRNSLEAGVRWVQYRDKTRSRREIYEESIRVRKITNEFNAVLIINDYADIALSVNADGVHLGQEDLPLQEARKLIRNKIIGISTHTLEQAENAEKDGADYIGFGPIFHTKTKDAGSLKGTDLLATIKNEVNIPVVAIGGITIENVHIVLQTGVDAVAVASAIINGDIKQNVRSFLDIISSFQ